MIRDREVQSEEVFRRREAEREQKLDEDKRLVQRATREPWAMDGCFFFLGLGPWNFLEKLRRLNRCGCLVEFSFPPGVWNGCFVGMKRYNCLVVSNIVHVEQF